MPPADLARVSEEGVTCHLLVGYVRVTIENSIVTAAGCRLAGCPWQVAEEEVAAVQHNIGVRTMKPGVRPQSGQSLKGIDFVFVISQYQVNRMRPFLPERTESGC